MKIMRLGWLCFTVAGIWLECDLQSRAADKREGGSRFARGRLDVPPIHFAADAKTGRDFSKAQRAWSERVFVASFRERMKGKEWEAAALAFVSHALDGWPGEPNLPNSAELSAEGRAVLAAGCTDPLVGYLAAWARWMDSGEWHGARTALRTLLPEAEQLPGSRALFRMMLADFIRASEMGHRDVRKEVERLAELTAAVANDGTYAPDEDFIFVRHIVDEPWEGIFAKYHEGMTKALEAVKLADWVRATIVGQGEEHLAWDSRGSDWAGKVKPEGWKGFEEHLALARKHLTFAWKSRPDQPMAAGAMTDVVMGGGAKEGETVRTWFDRATAAECDYFSAYLGVALSYLPRWGGSHEQMLKFGEACIATGRFDTEAPTGFFGVLSKMNRDIPDMRTLYRKPGIAPLVLRLSEAFVNEPARSGEKRMRQCFLAINAWLAGDNELAASALAAAGPDPFQRAPFCKLIGARTDEPAFRGMIAALNSPVAEAYSRAERAYDDHDLNAAISGFEEALKGAEGLAAAHMQARMEITAMEQKLAAGEWVGIAPNREIRGWTVRTGQWSASPAGMPTCNATDGPARIVYGARVGPNFEMKGEVEITGEPETERFPGFVFGDQFEDENWEWWQSCHLYMNNGPATATYLHRNGGSGVIEVACEPRPVNEFSISVENGKLTWSLNGKLVHDHVPLAREIQADAQIGIGSWLQLPGQTLTLRKLEIRRLK